MGYFFGRFALEKLHIRTSLKGARGLITISRVIENRARELFDVNKVFYLPNMIEDHVVENISGKVIKVNKPLKLVHVAWQAAEKGTLDLIKALSTSKCSSTCELVGEVADDNRTLIEQQIRDNGLSDKVALTGLLKGHDLEDKFLKADMFVFPSHYEGFPNAIMEAMAYGLPIIATDVGNIREMIDADGVSPAGILLDKVNPVDHQELSNIIDMLANDIELRRRLSINGQKRVKDKYMASKIVPQLEELLFELCGIQIK